MPNKVIKTTFNAGELAEGLAGRVDLAKYFNGCSEMVNAIPAAYGGFHKRPGLEYIATANAVEDKVGNIRLVPFEFSSDDVMVLEFGHEYIRFFRNGAAVMDGESVYEIVSPYDEDDLNDIHIIQSADVLYMAHTSYHPQKLSRLAVDNWTIEDVPFTGGPFLTENVDTDKTLEFEIEVTDPVQTADDGYWPAGTTGTVTASGHAPFLASHIGSLWQFKQVRDDNVLSDADKDDGHAIPTGNGVLIRGDFNLDISVIGSGHTLKLWRRENTGNWQEFRTFSTAIAYSATEENENVFYTFTTSVNTVKATLTAQDQLNKGTFRITAVSSSTVAIVVVVDPILDGSTIDTEMWAEAAFSGYRGYPRTLSFYENRLYWAGTTNNPQTLYGSRSNEYENHESGIYDNDAIIFTIVDSDVSEIKWMAAQNMMVLGTGKKEYALSASNPDDPMTQRDIRIRPQSSFGSGNLQSLLLNTGLFYSQKQGRRVRVAGFEETTQKFESDDATKLADHIFESPPVAWAAQTIPEARLWVVREDGQLVSFTYDTKEEVFSWARHTTGGTLFPDGKFESVCVVSGSREDEIWVSVARNIGGAWARYVERMFPMVYDTPEDSLFLDSAVIQGSSFVPQDIRLMSDTVRYSNGWYNSGLYGGTG